MSKIKPTQEQIDAEINALKTMKPNVLEESTFGDNHHDAIEAQLAVLAKRMRFDEIYDVYGDENSDEFASNVLDAAIDARNWLDGDSDDGAPSAGWVELIR